MKASIAKNETDAGNEEHQDKNRKIYKIIFSFDRKSCDQLVGSPCILLIHP